MISKQWAFMGLATLCIGLATFVGLQGHSAGAFGLGFLAFLAAGEATSA